MVSFLVLSKAEEILLASVCRMLISSYDHFFSLEQSSNPIKPVNSFSMYIGKMSIDFISLATKTSFKVESSSLLVMALKYFFLLICVNISCRFSVVNVLNLVI